MGTATWDNKAILETGKAYEQEEIDRNDPPRDFNEGTENNNANQDSKVALDKKVSDLDYLKSLSNTKEVEHEVLSSNSEEKEANKKENKKQKVPCVDTTA